MKATLLGYIVAESKKGTVGTTIYFTTEHDEYRRENALKCSGTACESDYIREDYSSVLTVGQEYSLVYGKGYEGKAVLQEIIPVGTK